MSAVLRRYAIAQVRAGAQAIQLFDTWAGVLAPAEYREFALRWARKVLDSLADLGVPRIYFALDSAHLFEDVRECGAEVIGVDWRTSLADASRRLGDRFVVQGNLDPCVLLATPDVVASRARAVLADGAHAPGHVVNLGHGILPETPVECAQAFVETVRGGSAA